MKNILITILLLISATIVKGQIFDEWFRQKATQRKYLLQQIAALQTYLGYVKQGYGIYEKGLNTIGDIKNGEFRLHKGHFDSLKMVNPVIASYSKVHAIITTEQEVVKIYHDDYRYLQQSGNIVKTEQDYCYGVYSRLMDDCTDVLDELKNVTTSGKLQMSDDERIARIDQLYDRMQDNYLFVRSFGSRAKLLATGRKREERSMQTISVLHGIQTK